MQKVSGSSEVQIVVLFWPSSGGMGPLDFHDLCFSDVFFFGGTPEANPPVKAPVLKVCSRETEILEPRDGHHMNYKHKSMKYSI